MKIIRRVTIIPLKDAIRSPGKLLFSTHFETLYLILNSLLGWGGGRLHLGIVTKGGIAKDLNERPFRVELV